MRVLVIDRAHGETVRSQGSPTITLADLHGTPLLPALRTTLPGPLNDVKLQFGGALEVRVNGEVATDATAALAVLDWPRTARPAFARGAYLIAFEEQQP